MLLLQSGFPKSGNYWLYKILHHMLLESGVGLKSYARSHPIYAQARTWPHFEDQAGIDYLEIDSQGLVFRKGSFTEPIPDPDAYLAQTSHVWTHSYWHTECAPVYAKFDRIVYIIRDPRDIAISASRYFFTPFMQQQHRTTAGSPAEYLDKNLNEILLSWVQHVGGYLLNLQRYKIYPLFYERLLADLPGEISQLNQYLELQIDPRKLSEIEERVTFSAMKSESPHHVRKGQAQQWQQELNSRQIEQAQAIAGGLMELLGYPQAADQGTHSLPVIPHPLDRQAVQTAVRESRGTLSRQIGLALQFLTSSRPMTEKLQKGLDYLLGRGRWKSAD